MHYPETPSTRHRLPGLLLQTTFYRCCETMRVHFMVLGCVNRTECGTKLLLMAVWASLVDCISSCHLLKVQHCSLSLNGCFSPPLAPHPPPPSIPPPSHPKDSICDITGTEKNCPKNQQHITALLIYSMQDIWRSCTEPQERQNAFNF